MGDKSLITISNEIRLLFREIEDNEGLITEEQEQSLKSLLAQEKEKVSGYISVLNRLENEKELVRSQIKNAQEYIKKLDKTQNRLEDIALVVIQEKGDRLEASVGGYISTRKSESLEIKDIDAVPIEYSRIKTEPDKEKIKEAIKRGEKFDFAEIKEKINVIWK